MATSLAIDLTLAIVGAYRKGASLCDVYQDVRTTYETTYETGEGDGQAEVILGIGSTNDGTTQTYDLRPLTDVWGNSNTWRKIRTLIVKSHDATATTSRYLLVAGTSRSTWMQASSTALLRVMPLGLFVWDAPSTNQFNLTPTTDTVEITGLGGSPASPLAYDLWAIGTVV